MTSNQGYGNQQQWGPQGQQGQGQWGPQGQQGQGQWGQQGQGQGQWGQQGQGQGQWGQQDQGQWGPGPHGGHGHHGGHGPHGEWGGPQGQQGGQWGQQGQGQWNQQGPQGQGQWGQQQGQWGPQGQQGQQQGGYGAAYAQSGQTQQYKVPDSGHEHPLNYTQNLGNVECKVCKQNLNGYPGYKCDQCPLILCNNCSQKIFYGNKAKQVHQHDLALRCRSAWKCDVCKEKFRDTASFYCKACDFDACSKCYVGY